MNESNVRRLRRNFYSAPGALINRHPPTRQVLYAAARLGNSRLAEASHCRRGAWAVFAVILSLLTPKPAALAGTVTVTILPEADAYVQGSGSGDTNFGAATTLAIRGDNHRQAYIRFNLNGLLGSVINARLVLTGGLNPPATSVKFVAEDGWVETTITNNNKPPPSGSAIAGSRATSSDPVEFDVTSFVATELAGDNKLSLNIHSTLGGSTSYNFDSRETATEGARRSPGMEIRPRASRGQRISSGRVSALSRSARRGRETPSTWNLRCPGPERSRYWSER